MPTHSRPPRNMRSSINLSCDASASTHRSIHFRARFLHDVGPFDDLGLDHHGKFLARVSDRLRTEPDDLLVDVGKLQDLHDLGIEALDDLRRRAGWSEYALPRSDLEAGKTRFRERG